LISSKFRFFDMQSSDVYVTKSGFGVKKFDSSQKRWSSENGFQKTCFNVLFTL